ncbi:MAG TPA: L,D-transpeptidase family protein [Rhizomicrobium sp.]|nr:L,D-transpeptidase family protein [Rhizomicrobium sp.]
MSNSIVSQTLIVETSDTPILRWDGGSARCAVGRGGIAMKRREGDGITPIGHFPIRKILYRPDRLARPESGLPVEQIAPDDGWCDAPGDPNYNRPVKLPYPASAESMWRDDRLYDVVALLGFNDDPVIDAAGSAIFLHCAREDYGPTEGCVALKLTDLLNALSGLKPGASIEIR